MTDRKLAPEVRWRRLLLGGVAACAGFLDRGEMRRAQVSAAKPPESATSAEAILRRTTDFIKKAKSAEVEVERLQKVGAQTVTSTFTIAFERPNRLAIRVKGGGFGVTAISDGTTLSVFIPPLHKYTQAKAPATLDALMGDPIVQSSVQGMMIGDLFAADPYASLMKGVKTTTYAGEEAIDGMKTHHLKFAQDEFDWELWVAADGEPTVRRVLMDLSKALAKAPGQFKNQKMEIIHNFKDWRIDAKLGKLTFTFQPPPESEKVEDFMAALAGSNPPKRSELVGKPAPDVNLKLLEQGEFRLKDHQGQHLIMLDFWATWCGPCVLELPLLAEVARDYKDKGLMFCAVNQREPTDAIRKFLKEKKLEFTVALDPEGAVGSSYHVEAIPALVLIDKKGVVQSVHVGYSPNIKATLHKEIDALLAGKDLAREALESAKAAPEFKAEGLDRAWSVDGAFSGVTTDPAGQSIYAVDRQGRCNVLDPNGKTIRTFNLTGRNHTIARFARGPGGSEGLLAFGPWGPSVLASRGDGTKLWEETGGQGVDDVWAADLDGDGVDEAIVGYNGSTGLHVFAADGQRRWQRTDMGNVWHVSAGDLDGDGKPEVVSTSARGKVHVFAPLDGTPVHTLDAGVYANMIRTALKGSIPLAKGDIVLVIGTAPAGGDSMVALGGDGKIFWRIDVPKNTGPCDSLAVSPDGKWAAAGFRGGRIYVVDIARGQIVAQGSGQGFIPQVVWAACPNPSTHLLLVATGASVNAFQVKPVAPALKSVDP